jgi:hypothetical protein
MIKWTSPDQGEFRKVLLKFYSSNQKLRLFVRDKFTYSLENLPDIAGTTKSAWAEALLEEAAGVGWIAELYDAFCSEHGGDPRILELRKDLKDPSLEVAIGKDGLDNSVVRKDVDKPLAEDPNSAHLVIAVFWQERDKRKIRVSSKLHYRDSNSSILQKTLGEDSYSIMLGQFPDFLKKLTDHIISAHLSRLFPDPIHPWKLTIKLFVPVDLLSQPLTSWCGKYQDLFRDRAVVIGCSDRFDPDRFENATNLHNQLKLGWERFQDKVPDSPNSNLQSLSWLACSAASNTSFVQYAGFQCYGNWLKPDEESLDNWQELVRSGIPLALWICEGSPDHQTIAAEFNYLIDGTRFAFLDKIQIVRDRLQRTCDHNIGIFYEDPHYLPDIPLGKEELFEWPGS